MSVVRRAPDTVPLVLPKGVRKGADGHDADHLFHGACICSCGDCTLHLEGDRLQCICPGCDRKMCGLRLRPTPLSVKR